MNINRIQLKIIDSTNTWSKLQAEDFPRDALTVVTASEQTGGRGRFKRHWVSPPDQNIYASFCFFVKEYSALIGNLPQVMALSAAKVLEKEGFEPQLKWPNDVLLSRKKVAGILAETIWVEGAVCVVIGIGINVNMPQEVLKEIDRPATSLLAESGKPYEIEKILESLEQQFAADLSQFFLHGFTPFLAEYRRRIMSAVVNPVRFHDNTHIWEGTFDAIHDNGSLSLLLYDGTKKTFLVGEILW